MKISELAKKANMPSKVLLIQIVKLGISAKSTQSNLQPEQLDKVLKALAKKRPSLDLESIKKGAAAVKKKKPTATSKASATAKKEKKPAKKAKPATEKKTSAKTSKTPKKTVAAKKSKKPTAKATKGDKPHVSAKEEPKPQAKELDKEVKPAEDVVQEEIKKIPPEKILEVKLPIIVKELAQKMSIGPSLVIKELMVNNIFANINQLIDEESAQKVAEKFGCAIKRLPTTEEEMVAIHEEEEDREEEMIHRPPVVTFMGHVDHGKTSLLDYIRKTKVTDKETGGITQHIGAYEVTLKNGQITFLDTPGHEAFTAMRARGANTTDLVVLVVAADDGIMPQTIEALDHARAAKASIIVAINKIDRENIDIDRVKKQLSEVELLAEDWGGKTITANVSAKTGDGIDNLLDMILLEAEMLELKANPNKPAKGVVIEAKVSKGGGPIATVLVQNGTLRQGDIVVAGQHYGKIRALLNDRIHRTQEAPPSMPVEILGLNGVPQAGDMFMVVSDEKKAKEISAARISHAQDQEDVQVVQKISLEDLYSEMQKGKITELKVILKADVRGSLEAIADSLVKLGTKNMGLNVIHKGVGDINESDILLAAASNAIVIGFHVRKTPEADKASKAQHVDLRLYNIIYEAVSDIKAAMEGLLEPDIKEVFMARIVIKQVFKLSKAGIIAGSVVQKGKVLRNADCRLIRDGEEIYKGKISSLKRFKDDVKEVAEGYECGVALESFKNLKAGDVIEAFSTEKTARRL